MSHWWVILFYNPATTWKVTPTTPETSFFTFFFPASHFFTDRVKLCSTNCLNIIFSAVGWVRAESGGVTPESTGEKKNLKCIWHSDKLHLPHHPVGSKESPMSTGAQIVVQKKTVSIQSHFLLAWVFSRLGDHYEPTWNNILQKEWHRRKPEALHSAHLKFKPLWYGFPSWANIQLLFFFFLSPHRSFARGLEGACSAARIASEGAWEASKPIESGATCQKRWPDYFLNAMFLWTSHSGDSPCDDCW